MGILHLFKSWKKSTKQVVNVFDNVVLSSRTFYVLYTVREIQKRSWEFSGNYCAQFLEFISNLAIKFRNPEISLKKARNIPEKISWIKRPTTSSGFWTYEPKVEIQRANYYKVWVLLYSRRKGNICADSGSRDSEWSCSNTRLENVWK